ncbi:1-deoxy-D-xylulose-5-phosphate reductoisomerase [Chrysiogenes arsenatis]|uniref:1-deoxy-D-xylulose-5-phosphate reductoisomerase n=1 Tax=Chrysiogenes arsenatis TaxID=309797 RepID=UPI00041712C9|nr:1-deoxy-D-xylulose-5-phosphate reductoisomerase [Chrysiogenes arsenatis]
MQTLAILGSTGSIGTSALEIVAQYPDRLQVSALAAGNNRELLLQQAAYFRPALISIASEADAQWLRQQIDIPVYSGENGLLEVACERDATLVLAALVGSAGIAPTLAAINETKDIALANKETLVAGGALVMQRAQQAGVTIFPVDSEHSAIFQCLEGQRSEDVSHIILTASGGALRQLPLSELEKATVHEALRHPNWNMGRKVTIDSATMMNKGLELIEARWLFNVHPDQLDVVIHPESIIHSLVEYRDGSFLAHLGRPSMKIPLAYAFFHPERHPVGVEKLRLHELATLHFEAPDLQRYPCLHLAQQVMRQPDSAAAVLNSANEVAVDAFLQGKITFVRIAHIVEAVLSAHRPTALESLEHLMNLDMQSRLAAEAEVTR